jgi:hypothetical protein
MIDALWFVSLTLVVPALIMWVLSLYLEPRPVKRGATRLDRHAWSMKRYRCSLERRKRERQGTVTRHKNCDKTFS